ncbi:MAG: hypothetical protein AB1346_04105 [Thermodesulfobacteriota bacterium]
MKKLMAILAAFALTAGMAGATFAGEMYELHGKHYKKIAKETDKSSDAWKGSESVDTGAVPGKLEKSKPNPLDTHYNPFFPELRPVDRSTGG